MRNFFRKLFILFLIISPISLWAHEGHGIVEYGPAHYLLSPEHSILLVVVVWGLILLINRVFARKPH